ncbi:SGNH/GDSL hydrolase family protein [Thermodesulfobacteriota bacterium]
MIRRYTLVVIPVVLWLAGWGCCGPADHDALYVAFGDSITAGAEEPSYPDILEGMLGLGDGTVSNEGDSGENAGDGRDRLAGLLDCNTYPNADTVLYWQGGAGLIDWIEENDSYLLISPIAPIYPLKDELADLLDHIQDNLMHTIHNIKDAGKTPIIGTYHFPLAHKTPCDPSPLGFLTETMARHVREYTVLLNGKIYELADVEGIEVADVASTGGLNWNPDNFHDCLHPSAQGNELIAGIWYETITGP